MKKVILKLELHDDKDKQKAMKKVSGISGVESISLDMKDKKLTVIGDIDPVKVAAKLRKLCHTEIVSVGPAKEPEKKKEEPKKDESKKEDPKKKDPKEDAAAQLLKAYQAYYQHHQHQFPPPVLACYPYRPVEEDPNACVIC